MYRISLGLFPHQIFIRMMQVKRDYTEFCRLYICICYNKYRNLSLIVTGNNILFNLSSFLDDSFRKNLESALRFGNPLLVQVSHKFSLQLYVMCVWHGLKHVFAVRVPSYALGVYYSRWNVNHLIHSISFQSIPF